MSLAKQLYEAVHARRLDEAAEKVVLMPGQLVSVRSKRGATVVKGRIMVVDPETGFFRVEDNSSGATLEVDVDPEKYIVWVMPPPGKQDIRDTTIKKLYVRGGGMRPSAYQGGKWP